MTGDPASVRSDRPLTDAYWAYLALRDHYGAQPQPALRWWMDSGQLSPSELAIFGFIKGCDQLLDVGAGNLRVKKRLLRHGFAGTYSTVDTSHDAPSDYAKIQDVPSDAYDAVLVLEVIEHIPLDEFDGFVDELLRVTRSGARFVFSTPNAEYYSTIWSTALDHRHPYRLADLAAYLHIRGIRPVTLQRVNWVPGPTIPIKEYLRKQLVRALTRGVLQVDYCRGVQLMGRRV